MLRIAVIGLGWAGSRHVEVIRELNDKLLATQGVPDCQAQPFVNLIHEVHKICQT